MANVTITSESYREATYLDCSIVYDTNATISGVGLTVTGTITIDDVDSEFENGDSIYISGVEGTTELNNRTFTIESSATISGTTQSQYELRENGIAVAMDAYTTYVSGTGTVARWATTISGLEHLEGLEVTTLAEGAILPNQTVSNATITLPYPIKYAIIGLGYDSYIQSMPLEVGNDLGASIGRRKKVADVDIRLYKTIGIEVGSDPDNTDIVPFRTSEMNMDEAVSLFTGDKRFMFNKGFSSNQTLCVRSSVGLPFTLLAIVPSLYTAPK